MLNYRSGTSDRYTLVIQIIRERRRSVIFTPYKLLPDEFDQRNGKAVATSRVRSHREWVAQVNALLNKTTAEVEDIVASLERDGKPFSAPDIAARYRQRSNDRFIDTFLATMAAELEQRGNHGTAATFRALITTFGRFAAGRRFRFDQLDEGLVFQFERFLASEKLKTNTITFYLSKLRAAYNKAVRLGLAPKGVNPFCNTSFRTDKTRKLAVGDEALKKVIEADFPGDKKLDDARDLFLFSFYARGMSFVDMAYLRQSDLRRGYIYYRRHKTGQPFAVKIVPALQEIIDRQRERCSPWVLPIMLLHTSEGTLVPMEYSGKRAEEWREYERSLHKRYQYSRSHYLRLLGRVSERLGLERPLTFNVARHTWASRARRLNIPMAVISGGLGHTSEKTTLIYLDELDDRRIDEANGIVTRI